MRKNILSKERIKRCVELQEFVLQIFFPRRCPLCDTVIPNGEIICGQCIEKIPYIEEPCCKKCGKQLENERQEYCSDCSRKIHFFKQGKAVFSYREEMKLSMYRFKYSNKREYADFYAEATTARYGDWIKRCGVEAIVPVPLYKGKKRTRGYNQAEIFAKALGRKTDIFVECSMLHRIKNTRPQKMLSDRQRKDNLKGAFQVETNIVKYSKILLVDDIYTTGATVDAIAELLIKAGVKEVYFISICIGEGY